jgi:hypothetical protein
MLGREDDMGHMESTMWQSLEWCSTKQGVMEIARNFPKASEEAWGRLSFTDLNRLQSWQHLHLTSSLQKCEKINFCFSKSPSFFMLYYDSLDIKVFFEKCIYILHPFAVHKWLAFSPATLKLSHSNHLIRLTFKQPEPQICLKILPSKNKRKIFTAYKVIGEMERNQHCYLIQTNNGFSFLILENFWWSIELRFSKTSHKEGWFGNLNGEGIPWQISLL